MSQIKRSQVFAVGLLALLTSLALILTFLERDAGRLAIEIGLIFGLFAVLAVVVRPLILEVLSIRDSDTEMAVRHGLLFALVAAIAFILLGLLNLMGVLPWWR